MSCKISWRLSHINHEYFVRIVTRFWAENDSSKCGSSCFRNWQISSSLRWKCSETSKSMNRTFSYGKDSSFLKTLLTTKVSFFYRDLNLQCDAGGLMATFSNIAWTIFSKLSDEVRPTLSAMVLENGDSQRESSLRDGGRSSWKRAPPRTKWGSHYLNVSDESVCRRFSSLFSIDGSKSDVQTDVNRLNQSDSHPPAVLPKLFKGTSISNWDCSRKRKSRNSTTVDPRRGEPFDLLELSQSDKPGISLFRFLTDSSVPRAKQPEKLRNSALPLIIDFWHRLSGSRVFIDRHAKSEPNCHVPTFRASHRSQESNCLHNWIWDRITFLFEGHVSFRRASNHRPLGINSPALHWSYL